MAANKRKIQANAQKYLQKGQLEKAQKEYQQLVKLDPRDANSRLKLGDIALRQGDKEGAAEAYLKVAEQFMKDGFDAKAVAIYKQVGKIDAERLDIYEPLAELYQRLGLTSEALAALQTAADAFHKEGRKRDALELLRKMATLDPTNTTSRLKIADLLRQADMPEDALAEYDAVAEELARQGARDELLGVYDRILELEPERTATLTGLAQILVDQGHVERAEPYARKLIEQAPDLPEGHELLARIHTELGREDAAAETYRTLAEVYRRIGDADKAREIAQRIFGSELASQGATGDGDATLGGDLSDLPKAPAGAEPDPDLMEQTLDLSGGDMGGGFSADAEQLLAEANVYLRYGKAERAIATLDALLSTDPDHRPALEKLGEAHADRGDAAKAIEIWKRAVEIALIEEDESAAATLGARIEALETGGPGAEPGASAAPQAPPDETIDEDLAPGDDISLEEVTVDEPDPEPEVAQDEAPAPGIDEEAAADDAASAAPVDEEVDLEIDLGDESLDEELSLEDDDAGEDDADLEMELEIEVDDEDSVAPLEADGGPAGAETQSEQEGTASAAEESDPQSGADQTVVQMGAAEETVFQIDDSDAELSVGGSATTPQQIAESLEEADFYYEQGLLDEAEALYEKVLESAPNHPQAMLRLGEIASKRGADPSSTGGSGPVAEDGDPESTPAAAAETDATPEAPAEAAGADATPEAAAEAADADATPEAAATDADADAEDLGDELVDWGDEQEEDVAAAPDEDVESDLEIDVEEEVALELGADDDPDADTAVSMQPPETQPEIELSLEDDHSASDATAEEDSDACAGEADDAIAEEVATAAAEDAEAPAPEGADETEEALSLEVEEALSLEVEEEELPEPVADEAESGTPETGSDAAIELADPEEVASASAAEPPESEETRLEAATDEAELEASSDEEELEAASEHAQAENDAADSEPAETPTETAEAVDEAQTESRDEAQAEAASEAQDEPEEGEGFDLAAELSDVFDEGDSAESSGSEGDEGFDAIFREFKKGVKEQLSESDYEAHYDLGIAYREMGLLDDAVSEFQTALDSPDLKLSSLHMLGLCALDLGQPRDASAHFEQALSLPAIPREQQAALRYDLGRAFESAGDPERARAAYEAVAAVDPDYQDVAERLAALGEAGAGVAEPVETFESFDDLIAEAEAALDTEHRQEDATPAEDESAAVPAKPEITQMLEDTAPEIDSQPSPGQEPEIDSQPLSGQEPAIDSQPEPVGEPVLEAVLEAEVEPEATVQAEQTEPPGELPEVVDDDDAPDPDPAPRRRRKKISFL